MPARLSPEEQHRLLCDGTAAVLSEKALLQKLEQAYTTQKPLRVKYGADPSAPDLHLGHTVSLRKLRQFQDLGHLVVFIIGDFTARIGDPSHKSQTRPMLSQDQIEQNAASYKEQIFRILDPEKTELKYNSQWLGAMDASDFLTLTAQYTVARLLERDDFAKRHKEGRPIAVVEFIYPLLQGWDSVIVRADIELGGTDQTFNLLVGRELQNRHNQAPQVVMTMPLLEGTDGVEKMSKSLKNHIGIQDKPQEMFGKIMSIPDTLIEKYARLVGAYTPKEYQEIKTLLDDGNHARDIKANLAQHIVTLFYDKQTAAEAQNEFNAIFRNKALPSDIQDITLPRGCDLITALVELGLSPSRSQAKRDVAAGAVKINQEKVTIDTYTFSQEPSCVLQNGKRKFMRIIWSN